MIAPTPTLAETARANETRDAETIMRALHDLLWDPYDPAREWDSETIEHVAEIVDAYYPGRLAEKHAAVYGR